MKSEYRKLLTDEKVFNTSIGSIKNGSYIIMGADKYHETDEAGMLNSETSGPYSNPDAGSIDLFVGLNKLNTIHPEVSSIYNEEGKQETVYLSSDFSKDAARIYISEKASPDLYFDLKDSKYSPANLDLSTVCLLADAVRIVGRNSVKIVTRERGVINSTGKASFAAGGIHLIAGNKPDKLQPIPLGINLVSYLEKKDKMYNETLDILRETISQEIFQIWQFLSLHTHIASGPGAPTAPPTPVPAVPTFLNIGTTLAKKTIDLLETTNNETKLGKLYLNSTSSKFILSDKNMVN